MQFLWSAYSTYAPRNFLDHLQYEEYFKQRWWEMYLGVGLINLGFNIQTSKRDIGPDFRINFNDKTINIEAIAPKMGSGDDKLPAMEFGVFDLKSKKEKYLLRLSSAIKEKKDKFEKYISDKVTDGDDVNIIALSNCDLDQYGSLMNSPVCAPESVLHDVGYQFFDLYTGENGYTSKCGIRKENGSYVSTSIFELEEYKIISAIIYSNGDILNSPDNPESTFVLIENENAENKIEKELIRKFLCSKI